MTLSLDDLTHKKLALVKQLFQHGLVQSSVHDSIVNRILSVISLDLAVENALRIVISALDTTVQIDADRTFPNLVQKANHELQKTGLGLVPDEAKIKSAHKIRNDAQHNARYPTQIAVSDCQNYTEDFLGKIIKQVWDISFDDISLVGLIDNATVRDYLTKAEIALAQDDYKEAVRNANVGFSWAVNKVPRVLLGDSFKSLSWSFDWGGRLRSLDFALGLSGKDMELWDVIVGMQKWLSESFRIVSDEIEAMQRKLDEKFAVVQDTLIYFTLGLNHADLLRFRTIAGNIHFLYSNKDDVKFNDYGMKESISRNEAEFVVAYCINVTVAQPGTGCSLGRKN